MKTTPFTCTAALSLALGSFFLSLPAHAGSFQGLGYFESPTPESRALAVSGDGKVVVGISRGNDGLDFSGQGNQESFRWTAETGMVRIPSLQPNATIEGAYGISFDGQVVVGVSEGQAYTWTQETGSQPIPFVPGLSQVNYAYGVSNNRVIVGSNQNSTGDSIPMVATQFTGSRALRRNRGSALSISASGAVIVGNSNFGFGLEGYSYPAVWSRNGVQKISPPPSPIIPSTRGGAGAVSADGTTVVGAFLFGPPFYWTKKGGTVLLPELPNAIGSYPHAVSADGSVIVGGSGGRGVIWTKQQGIRLIKDVMEHDYGIDLSEWEGIGEATGVSADGKVIVGGGTRHGIGEAWIAILD